MLLVEAEEAVKLVGWLLGSVLNVVPLVVTPDEYV